MNSIAYRMGAVATSTSVLFYMAHASGNMEY